MPWQLCQLNECVLQLKGLQELLESHVSTAKECHEQLQSNVHSSVELQRARRTAVCKAGPNFQQAKAALISEFWRQHEASGQWACDTPLQILTSHERLHLNIRGYEAVWLVTLSESQKIAIIEHIYMLGHELEMLGYKLAYEIVDNWGTISRRKQMMQESCRSETQQLQWEHQQNKASQVGEVQQINGYRNGFVKLITLAIITSK